MESNSIDHKASHTALMAVIYRFLATKEKRVDFRGPDNMAYIFMPPRARFFLSFSFFRNLFKKKLNEKGPGSYEYVNARTKFFDDLFIKEIKNNIPQIVLLGAGYDTRSFRFQGFLNKTQIFEVDAPTTQNEKIKFLKKNKIVVPENLTFVPVDFNLDKLNKSLLKAGYDSSRRTLFIWEGVSMYITEEAVNETLSFIRRKAGLESIVAFDYLYSSVIRNECTYYGAKEIADIVKASGESFTFGIEEGKIDEFLNDKGFTLMAHFTPAEFEKKYLYSGEGEFLGKMYGFACHAVATNEPINNYNL